MTPKAVMSITLLAMYTGVISAAYCVMGILTSPFAHPFEMIVAVVALLFLGIICVGLGIAARENLG